MPTTTTVRVSCAIDLTASGTGSAVLLVHPAVTDTQQTLDEHLEVDGADAELELRGAARPLRLRAPRPGPVTVRFAATVELAQPSPDVADATAPLPEPGDLDLERLHWTLPTRYCPSDVLASQATLLFGERPRDRGLLEVVRSWVEEHVAYLPGGSDPYTAADETFLRRQGVCRDLAHLTITFLRALDVPARMVAAYAPGLEPPDFHAVVEAHDGHSWRLLDPSALAPLETTVRIATGADATAIAWMTGTPELTLDRLQVTAERT